MIAMIGQLLNNVARCGAALLERLNLPEQRRKAAAKALAKDSAAKDREQADTSAAVYSGEKDAVNATLGRVLKLVVITCMMGACGCVVCSCGKTIPVYVPADRAVIPETRDGIAGWFVPNATLNDLLHAAQRARDLEEQKAVTARMEGKQ